VESRKGQEDRLHELTNRNGEADDALNIIGLYSRPCRLTRRQRRKEDCVTSKPRKLISD
jgi:hypothetical protein